MSEQEKETLMKFPCDFTFKIMGRSDGEFEKVVLEIMKKHFPAWKEDSLTKKHSKDGNYLSMNVTVYAENKAELDAAYIELSGNDHVLFAL